MSTTQELMQSSMDLRARRIHKVASLQKVAADEDPSAGAATMQEVADAKSPTKEARAEQYSNSSAGAPPPTESSKTGTPATGTPAAPKKSALMDMLGKVPPEAWGAILGLSTGAGIGSIWGGKGALIGGGIGAGVGAGAGNAYRNRDAIAGFAGEQYGKAKGLVNKGIAKGEELIGSAKATGEDLLEQIKALDPAARTKLMADLQGVQDNFQQGAAK
jgi:hypothetical protein